MCWTVSCWAKMAMVTLVFGVTLHIVGWPYMNWMAHKTSGSVLEMLERVAGLWNQKSCTNIYELKYKSQLKKKINTEIHCFKMNAWIEIIEFYQRREVNNVF